MEKSRKNWRQSCMVRWTEKWQILPGLEAYIGAQEAMSLVQAHFDCLCLFSSFLSLAPSLSLFFHLLVISPHSQTLSLSPFQPASHALDMTWHNLFPCACTTIPIPANIEPVYAALAISKSCCRRTTHTTRARTHAPSDKNQFSQWYSHSPYALSARQSGVQLFTY